MSGKALNKQEMDSIDLAKFCGYSYSCGGGDGRTSDFSKYC